MCLEEFMNGNGLLSKEGEGSIKQLKENLLSTYNQNHDELEQLNLVGNEMTLTVLNKLDAQKKSGYQTPNELGKINLNLSTGEFDFHIHEASHTVELAEETDIFRTLLTFISTLDKKGTEYGARSYYWNDSHDTEDGYTVEGQTKYYGGWKKKTLSLLSKIV